MAVTVLNASKPPMAVSNKGRRFQLRVAATTGMAASTDPRAYTVTSWPASASEMPSPRPIWGSRPAGMVSVMMARKPAIVNASNFHTGRPAGRAEPAVMFA
ncbi:hypothetical protein D9M68_656510 [compost metagenome]